MTVFLIHFINSISYFICLFIFFFEIRPEGNAKLLNSATPWTIWVLHRIGQHLIRIGMTKLFIYYVNVTALLSCYFTACL